MRRPIEIKVLNESKLLLALVYARMVPGGEGGARIIGFQILIGLERTINRCIALAAVFSVSVARFHGHFAPRSKATMLRIEFLLVSHLTHEVQPCFLIHSL